MPLPQAQLAVVAVAGSHLAIDRRRLAGYFFWAKNWLGKTRPWRECAATGYPPDRPSWLAVWLLIGVVSILPMLGNGLALLYL